MAEFFQEIVNRKLFNDWAGTLDWLTNDKRFDESIGWNRGATNSFTAKIKKIPYFSSTSYKHAPKKEGIIQFPTTIPESPTIYMYKGESAGRDIVRHIRNGIVHGHTCILSKRDRIKKEKVLYIEIKDYKDTAHTEQTAYFYIPMDFILRLHELYKEVLKTRNSKETSNKKQNNRRRNEK